MVNSPSCHQLLLLLSFLRGNALSSSIQSSSPALVSPQPCKMPRKEQGPCRLLFLVAV